MLRRLAALSVTLLAAAAVSVAPAQAGEPELSRVGGADRFATAATLARAAFPDGAASAVVASGEDFPDALSAAYLAGQVRGPVLLTRSDELRQVTRDALQALQTKKVYVVGGDGAVSGSVLQSLAELTDTLGAKVSVQRVAGADRYGTAAATATVLPDATVGVVHGARTALLASGEDFPDAVAASSAAAAGHLPLLLTRANALSPQVLPTLQALDIDHVVLVGGPGAITPAVQETLQAAGVSVDRVGGNDRVQTATALASWEISTLGFAGDQAAFARGDTRGGGLDALALAPLAASVPEPVLLTASPTSAGAALQAWLDEHPLIRATVAGGTGAVSPDLFAILHTYLNNPVPVPPDPAPAPIVVPVGTVVTVDTGHHLFTVDPGTPAVPTDDRTFTYDSNDAFEIQGPDSNWEPVDLATFEAALSPGDSVNGEVYRPNAAGRSTFRLVDSAPLPPESAPLQQIPSGDNMGHAGIEVTFPDSSTASVGSYNIYRATAELSADAESPACPTPVDGPYAKLASVADTDGSTSYAYFDATAQQPTPGSTPADVQYCYYLTSVDRTGDEGVASSVGGPFVATGPGPRFAAVKADTTNPQTVVVTYDQPLAPGTVDAGDYKLTWTSGGTTAAYSISNVSPVYSGPEGVGVVTLTIGENLFDGETVTVTARAGFNGTTVGSASSPTIYQPVGDSIQTTASDQTAPTLTGPASPPIEGATTVVFGASNDIDPATIDASDFTKSPIGTSVSGVAYDAAAGTITVTVDPLPAGETVTAMPNSMADRAGNVGPADSVTSQPAVDVTPPEVTPPDSAPAVGATSLVFGASKDLDTGQDFAEAFFDENCDAAITGASYDPSGGTITVTTEPLESGCLVYVLPLTLYDRAHNLGPLDLVAAPPAAS